MIRKKLIALSLALAVALNVMICSAFAEDTGGIRVKSIRLMEQNYIEIIWSGDVVNSTLAANYTVMLNNSPAELDTGKCYYYDKFEAMTSLKLKTPVLNPGKAHIRLTVNTAGEKAVMAKNGARLDKKEYSFGYSPFYTQKVVSKLGFAVKGSPKTDIKALKMVAATADFMLSKNPQVAKVMIQHGADVGVTGKGENAYYLPEYRDMTDPNSDPAEGLGGTVSRPTTSIVQAEVLQSQDSLYRGENIGSSKFVVVRAERTPFLLLRECPQIALHSP